MDKEHRGLPAMKRGKVLHSGVRKINELWNALFPETVRYVPNPRPFTHCVWC